MNYEDSHINLKCLLPAHMDWGKFREALDYSHHQLGISEELDNPQMRSEAYLNISTACGPNGLGKQQHTLSKSSREIRPLHQTFIKFLFTYSNDSVVVYQQVLLKTHKKDPELICH